MVTLGVITPSGTVKTIEDLKAVISAAIEKFMENNNRAYPVAIDELLWEFIDDPEGVEAIFEWMEWRR